MDTTFADEYKNWIKGLSEKNFKDLIVNFNKEYYETKDVYISDGPYDGGIDLVVNTEGKELKKNIQITVQDRNFEKKLFKDLEKSKENVSQFNYMNTLVFYISSSISKTKKNQLIKKAEIEYQINLIIIDANQLGELATDYKSIKNTIKEICNLSFPDEEISIDKNTKILFDILSLSKDMTVLKTNFIQSLILSFIYQKTEANIDEIYNGLKGRFYDGVKKVFFESEVGKLKEESKIINIPDTHPKIFKLDENVLIQLQEIDDISHTNESSLTKDIEEVLKCFNLSSKTKEIASYLMNLYDANYEIDGNEVLSELNGYGKKIQTIYKSLTTFLMRNSEFDETKATNVANKLLEVCTHNKFLNKVSISKMFMNLFKSNKLEKYLSSSPREVYLDTQVLLQIICCEYQNIDYNNTLYKGTKMFLDAVEQSSIPIELYTTNEYIDETTWHVIEAIKLEKFLELPYIKDLGPSKNVIFNFYLELKNDDIDDFTDFTDFINTLFNIDISSYNNMDDLYYELNQSITERFDLSNIEIKSIPKFDNYDIYKKEYEIALSYIGNDQKSYEARKHDLNTILYLSDNNFSEPFLISWDISFYEIRKCFERKFKELNYWYLYSPVKFANTISVANFKIDSSAINYNIISLVEENFNLSNDSISFLDLISSLFTLDNSDITKWELVNKLASLRKNLLRNDNSESANSIKYKNLPIDELLLFILKYYQDPQNGKNYDDVVLLFQNNKYVDDIERIIKNHLNDFKIKEGQTCIIKEIDKMILKEKNIITSNQI